MYEVTLKFEHYPDLLNIMKVVNSKGTDKAKALVGRFKGRVGVVIGSEILSRMSEDAVSQYRLAAVDMEPLHHREEMGI